MSDKLVAGVDFSGAAKTPNDTWIAIGRVTGWQFQLVEVRKIGSHALAAELNKVHLDAVGIDCPFSLPVEFIDFIAQKNLRKNFQSWQEVAEHLVFCSFDDFKALAVEFKKEPKRVTDKSTRVAAQSPLHRGNPSMIQMTHQGIRLLATLDPSKFSVLPFQPAQANKCAIIEVYPREFLKFLELPDTGYKAKTKKDDEDILKLRRHIIGGLVELRERKKISLKEFIRLSIPKQIEHQLITSDHALDAVIASYITALYVSTPQLFSDPFATDNMDVLMEGWIYTVE